MFSITIEKNDRVWYVKVINKNNIVLSTTLCDDFEIVKCVTNRYKSMWGIRQKINFTYYR